MQKLAATMATGQVSAKTSAAAPGRIKERPLPTGEAEKGTILMYVNEWAATMQAAVALDADRFTICLGELEYDDPFTAIISYDGQFPQPWSRTDVRREIVDVAYLDIGGSEGFVPVSLSNEGDVYVVKEDRAEWSKIPGAGVLSEDAEGFGAVHALVVDGARQYVVGNSRQLYQRDGLGDWQRISADVSHAEGYEAEHFGGAIAVDGALLIEAFQRPASETTVADLDPKRWENMTQEQFLAMMDEDEGERSTRSRQQRLYTYRDGSFTERSVPQDIVISGLYRDEDGSVWLLGVNGLIMRSRSDGSFETLGFHGDTETLFSAARRASTLYFATDDGLRSFDGHKLKVVKPVMNSPSINQNVPVPLKIQAFGNMLVYFDRKHGVARWDGTDWKWVEIPPELLERDFKRPLLQTR